uniref:protein timeless homolog n=1 Tax=Ciona intestinalis TaxID=7719 RepID=UPI00089DBA58|nr:protein timeless homolog [Ciona intestinalis]|eukprot:XP_018672329.1 protein timeless homolog [Ciona intestinalis]
MNTEILSTCASLGYLEDDKYFKEVDCLDSIKYLIKYLHNDDNNHSVRIQLGESQILQNDLIPLLIHYANDGDLFQTVLRLVVNLTQPTLLCFGGKVPKDTLLHHHFLQIVAYNQGYKEAFGSGGEIWKILSQKVYDVLETEWEDRRPEVGLLVERILILIRNLLHIPPTNEDRDKTSNFSSHDKIIREMHIAEIDSLILYVSGSPTEQEWCLHIIEIICLLLKEQVAETLGKTGKMKSESERQKEGDELLNLRRIEETKKKAVRAKMNPWHSRFGGTFVHRGTKSISDERDLIVHKAVRQCDKVTFDDGKAKLKKARNRRALVQDDVKCRSSLNIRNTLKEFCSRLLDSSYNVLMKAVKDRLSREKAQDHDETYYFWAMSFFLQFNRHCTSVLILSRVLMTVHTMEQANDTSLKEASKVILNNIFYVVEYREIFLTLLRKFDERKQTRGFLKDVVKATHLFLKMFENYCKDNTVVVEKRIRSKKKKKKAKKPIGENNLTEEERALKWGEVQTELREFLQETSPATSEILAADIFDPTSDQTEEEQQRTTVVKIQRYIHAGRCSEAVSTLRVARELWPEKQIFGSATMTSDEELTSLQEVCLADLTSVAAPQDNEESEEEESDEEVLPPPRSTEVEFNYQDYLKKFADSRIMVQYVRLLKEFDQNDEHVNHCLVKMLHRVGFTLKMYGLLFHVSLFRVFQKVNASVSTKSSKELVTFARWLLSKFHEVAARNPTLFMEMLFWKQSAAEVYDVTEGYGSFSSVQGKSAKVVWTDDEVAELTELFHKYKDQDIDTVDGILSDISNDSRSRLQVCKQLVRQGLAQSMAELKKAKGTKSVAWREDDVNELKILVEEFKSSSDPIGNILQMMSNKKPRATVINKVLALGLVNDRKELHKKRKTTPRNNKQAEPMHIGGRSDSEDEPSALSSDDDSEVDETVSAERCSSLIRDYCNHGDEDCVAWIQTSLKSALEDRGGLNNDETAEPVPLVPVTEEQESALDDRHFKKLLKLLGLQPPDNEQERYWRIPGSMSPIKIEDSILKLKPTTNKRQRMPSTSSESEGEIQPSEKKQRRLVIDDDE